MTSLKSIFQSLKAESCPFDYNFHLHTVYSDGQLHPEALVQQAISYGLKGLAITDHHTIAGYQAARRWLDHWNSQIGQGRQAPYLWAGVEITSALLDVNVHILGYGFDPHHAEIAPYLGGQSPVGQAAQAAQVIQSIQNAGGLAVLAHPARYKRSPADLIQAAVQSGIDGVESFYSYTNLEPWKSSPEQTRQVQKWVETYGLLQTCGTDSHGMSILRRI